MSHPTFTFDDIARAQVHAHAAHRTPVFTSATANEMTGAEIFFKRENFQRTGAFKFRGAYNALSLLSKEQRARGVVAFSGGNHAQGVALSGRLLGINSVIVMPADAPASKIAATRPSTIADGAQAQHLGNDTFPVIQQHVSQILTVGDDELVDAMKFFASRMKMVVEPTGCLGAAAAFGRKIDLRGKRVGVVISGGNVDLIRFAALTQ